MRLPRPTAALAVPVVLAAVVAGPVRATPIPIEGGVSSPNVQWRMTVPEAGAISAHFVTDAQGRATHLYVSTVQGLAIYDVTTPELPVPVGRLPLPNFENEDVDGNDQMALISTSPGGRIFVVDTRNKRLPVLSRVITTDDGDAHTSNCLDDCARWMYATEGQYLKLVDLKAASATIARVPYGPVGPVHDVEQDDAGVVWMSGDTGVAGFAVAPLKFGSALLRARTRKASPANPVKITDMVVGGYNVGKDPAVNRNILHNAMRPVDATYRQQPGRPRIGRGGVLLVTEELKLDKDNLDEARFGECHNAGRFHTFDATDALKTGAPLRLLDTFSLSEGTLSLTRGDKQVGNAFCGAHWFTVNDNVVAIGMYGAGTRFLDISDPRDIKQVGFFFSAEQETWGSYWVPGSNGVVYSIDLERGIDVLTFTKPAAGSTYLAPPPVSKRISFLRPRSDTAFGYACPLVVREPKRRAR